LDFEVRTGHRAHQAHKAPREIKETRESEGRGANRDR